MKNNDVLHDFFSSYSKVVIYIPLIIIVLGIILKLSSLQKPEKNKFSNPPTPTINSKKNNQIKKKTKIDLIGPYICQTKIDEASVSAFIENKKIFAKMVEKNSMKNFLFDGDCFYMWKEKEYNGEKICGLGQYLFLISDISSSTLELIGSFTNQPDLLNDLPIDEVLSSCRNEPIENKEVFKVPSFVIFKNIAL